MSKLMWGRWSSGKTQDSESRGPGFEPAQNHQIFLSQEICITFANNSLYFQRVTHLARKKAYLP